jgi:hypothetical protein
MIPSDLPSLSPSKASFSSTAPSIATTSGQSRGIGRGGVAAAIVGAGVVFFGLATFLWKRGRGA